MVPVRIDAAGGWTDVPSLAVPGGYIVNCTVTPGISRYYNPYQYGGGLGGSAASKILMGDDAFGSELEHAGWQDPAVINETGLCVWRSGQEPVLDIKMNPDWLTGHMAIWWTGKPHRTGDLVHLRRDYRNIKQASLVAREAVLYQSPSMLCSAISASYDVQIWEGMELLPKPDAAVAWKYLGSGWGGYALYFFAKQPARDDFVAITPGAMAIEPFMKPTR